MVNANSRRALAEGLEDDASDFTVVLVHDGFHGFEGFEGEGFVEFVVGIAASMGHGGDEGFADVVFEVVVEGGHIAHADGTKRVAVVALFEGDKFCFSRFTLYRCR